MKKLNFIFIFIFFIFSTNGNSYEGNETFNLSCKLKKLEWQLKKNDILNNFRVLSYWLFNGFLFSLLYKKQYHLLKETIEYYGSFILLDFAFFSNFLNGNKKYISQKADLIKNRLALLESERNKK